MSLIQDLSAMTATHMTNQLYKSFAPLLQDSILNGFLSLLQPRRYREMGLRA